MGQATEVWYGEDALWDARLMTAGRVVRICPDAQAIASTSRAAGECFAYPRNPWEHMGAVSPPTFASTHICRLTTHMLRHARHSSHASSFRHFREAREGAAEGQLCRQDSNCPRCRQLGPHSHREGRNGARSLYKCLVCHCGARAQTLSCAIFSDANPPHYSLTHATYNIARGTRTCHISQHSLIVIANTKYASQGNI